MKPTSLLVALCCVVWLHGCASTQRIVSVPSVCPAPRELPSQLAQELPPQLPALTDYLPKFHGPDGAAEALRQIRIDSAGQYQACLASRAALIEWARQP